jgi:hypothetical protein
MSASKSRSKDLRHNGLKLARQYQTHLRRSYSKRKKERVALAEKLEMCSTKARCGSAACPRCATAANRRLIKALTAVWRNEDLITMTVIIPKLHRPVGKLASLKPASAKRHLRRKLEAAGLGHMPVFAYLEVSHNVHAQRAYEEHWAPHFNLITPAKYASDLDRLRLVLKTDDSVKRSGRRDPVRDHAQLSYAVKTRPLRRTDFDKTSPKARPTKQWLKPGQLVEHLLWADHRPSEFQFLMNMRQYGDSIRLT